MDEPETKVKIQPLKRLRFKMAYETYSEGEIHYVPEDKAEFLLKNGYAVMSKDMTPSEIRQRNLSHDSDSEQRPN